MCPLEPIGIRFREHQAFRFGDVESYDMSVTLRKDGDLVHGVKQTHLTKMLSRTVYFCCWPVYSFRRCL